MQIKTVPFDKPFLPLLAKYIAEKHADKNPDFSSILVVFPSERNKVYFREYLLEETGGEGIIPPCLLTVGQLYDYIFEKTGGIKHTIPQNIERNVLLKESTQEVRAKNFKNLPFIKFISIGRKLLALFDELAEWNMSIEEIEDMKDKLHFPAQYIDEELPIIKKIYQKYIDNLGKRGLVDTSLARFSIAENFRSECLEEFDCIYIAGVLALPAADIFLIKKILSNLPSELILHSDKSKLQDYSLDNIFYHHSKILKLLEADINKIEVISKEKIKEKKPTHITIQKCKNMLDEVSFMIDCICTASQKCPLERIGIMLPEESFYLPLTDALKKFNIPFNLSMGVPFKHSQLYALLKNIHEFIDSEFSSSPFLILLKNPVLRGIKSFRELTYKLDEKVRTKNLSFVNNKFKDKKTQPVIDYVFKITSKLNENVPFAGYVKNLKEIVRELAELNGDFYKKNEQILSDVMDNLSTIERSKVPDELFSCGKDKLKFIISILETLNFPTSGDFLNGVQVIGILEARNIDFDCIIIPSCNEGILPQKSEKDLFLPANLRKEAGLPYYKERDALYSYYFHQLITNKQNVYLSYRVDENAEIGLRSRWIEKLLQDKNEHFIVKESNKINFANIFITGKPKKEVKPHGVDKDKRTLNSLKKFTFSPSSLKTYKQCTYKFYLSYILGMKEPPAIKDEYDPSIWGIILHNTLARLYDEKYPKGYKENIRSEVIKNLLKIGEEEFNRIYPNPKAALVLEWELNKKRLANFVDKEIKHFAEGFRPIRLEAELKPYILNVDNRLKAKIGGRPDRIDNKGKKIYVIDYKMGKKPSAKSYRLGEDFTEFQLPLYALIFTGGKINKVGGLIYYHLDETREKFITLDILEKEGDNYIERFKEEILIPTFRDMFNEKVRFNLTEDFDICQNCIFIDHCRRRI